MRRLRPATSRAIARMCSGVVPQQPPTIAAPGLDEGRGVFAQIVGRGEVDVAAVDDARIAGVGHHGQRARRRRSGSFGEEVVRLLGPERAVHADGVGAGQRQRRQGVRRPLRRRPSGRPRGRSSRPRSGSRPRGPRTARTASAASRRLPKVSSRKRSTPDSSSMRACSSKISRTCESWSDPYGLTSAPSGPIEPATKTSSPAAASRASRTPSRLIFSSESAHSWAVSLTRLASQVFVVRMRAPASTVVVVDLPHGFRVGEVQGRRGLLGEAPREISSVPIAPSASSTSSASALRKSFFILKAQQKSLSMREAPISLGPVRGAPHLLLHPAENPELAPVDPRRDARSGCRGVVGPVPRPLWMRRGRFGRPGRVKEPKRQ